MQAILMSARATQRIASAIAFAYVMDAKVRLYRARMQFLQTDRIPGH